MTFSLAFQFLEYLHWVCAGSPVWGMPRMKLRHLGWEGAMAQPDQDCDQAVREVGWRSVPWAYLHSHLHRAAKIIKPFWAVNCCSMLAYYSPSQGDFSSVLNALVTSTTGKPEPPLQPWIKWMVINFQKIPKWRLWYLLLLPGRKTSYCFVSSKQKYLTRFIYF